MVDKTTTVFQPGRNHALSDPPYDLNEANAYLEMYDSILSPQMLILHALNLKKCLLLSKNGYLSILSDSMTDASDRHLNEETYVRNQLFSGGPIYGWQVHTAA